MEPDDEIIDERRLSHAKGSAILLDVEGCIEIQTSSAPLMARGQRV